MIRGLMIAGYAGFSVYRRKAIPPVRKDWGGSEESRADRFYIFKSSSVTEWDATTKLNDRESGQLGSQRANALGNITNNLCQVSPELNDDGYVAESEDR
jgi:hypothetical protein